ncbi:MAG: hypothetical protein ACON4Z_03040 [Planctomycetota bacterium]
MNTRRRFSERLLLVVNVVVVNAVAALWVAAFLQPDVLGASAAVEAGARVLVVPLQTLSAWLALFAGAGLLLWNFAFLVRRRDDRAPSHWVVSDGPGGPVRVTREALEAGLRAAGEALPEITRLRVGLDLSNPKRLRVSCPFSCAEGRDHHAGSQRLRAALEQRFRELVRLSDGSKLELELEFQGFAGKAAKGARDVPAPAVEASADDSFRGPQYPIDDEEGERR